MHFLKTCLLFFLPIGLYAQTQIFTPTAADFEARRDLLPYAEVWVDTTQKIDYQQVIQQKFEPFDTSKLRDFKKWTTYWVKITLHNSSATEILRGGFSTPFVSKMTLFAPDTVVHNGGDIAYSKRVFKPNAKFLPFTLLPDSTVTFYCRIETQYQNIKPLFFQLKTEAIEERDRLKEFRDKSSMVVFRCLFILRTHMKYHK
jgi:7TMR-DISM extracellular 2